MKVRHFVVLGCAVAGVAGALTAWQGLVGSLGISEKDRGLEARQFFSSDTMYSLPGTYRLSREVRQSWLKRPAADRVALVRELGAVAKAFVMAPAFEQTYNGWIKEQHHAVNHGINAERAGETQMQQMMQPGGEQQMKNQMAGQIAAALLKTPPESLKFLIANDIQQWGQENDAKHKKLAERAKAVQPMFATNPEEARRQYVVLKSIEMGGPDNLQALGLASEAAAKQAASGEQINEQRAYDQYKLRVVLKKRLAEFITLARSVNFHAQTKEARGRIVFVNPNDERRPKPWKQLYRLGPEATQAAIAVAEQWLKEL
jgi:hypothetical protein